jgi:MFS family permease
VLHGITLVCYDNFLALHIRHLGHPDWVTGTSVAFSVAIEIAVMMSGRRLLDALGPERLLLAAVLVGIPHAWLTGAATDPLHLIAIQGLRGVAFGGFWIAGVSLLSERAPPALGSSAQALLPATSFGLGYLACSALAAVVLDLDTTATLFRAMALLDALAAIAVVGVLARSRAVEASTSSIRPRSR